jgi:hypothetical protein
MVCHGQTLYLIGPICKLIGNLSVEYVPWAHIQNTSFSLKVTREPNKLEHYITTGWEGLGGTNTPAY